MTTSKPARFTQIGLDRLLRLRWLHQVANLMVAGDDYETIKEYLRAYIQGYFPSSDSSVRGSIDKTLTILMKIWVRPPKDLIALRDRGLELLKSVNDGEDIAVHWGMTMAVYPFWGAVASSTGKLLGLQGTASALQVQRRLREKYGERQTVSRRARYLLRSFIDWEVLMESDRKGAYFAGKPIILSQPNLIAWLLAALLHSIPSGRLDFQLAIYSKSLFPFQIAALSPQTFVSEYPGLDIFRHGLDQVTISLANDFH